MRWMTDLWRGSEWDATVDSGISSGAPTFATDAMALL